MSSHGPSGAQVVTRTRRTPVVPFLVGAAVGGLAGAVVGMLLSGQAAHVMATLIDVVERRDDKGRPKFELLLQ